MRLGGGTWQDENDKRTRYKTREPARADIFDYIERFDNLKRTRSYLDYVGPVQYEKQAVGT